MLHLKYFLLKTIFKTKSAASIAYYQGLHHANLLVRSFNTSKQPELLYNPRNISHFTHKSHHINYLYMASIEEPIDNENAKPNTTLVYT